MQKLTKLIEEAKKRRLLTEGALLNLIREYVQVLILKAIYQTKYGKGLSFLGGTCLRICHDLKRFSEGLDFALDRKVPGYSFTDCNHQVVTFLQNTGFEVQLQVNEDKIVQKSFIRFDKLLHPFGASPLPNQKLHVKLEVDTRPVPIPPQEMETFFVTKFQEIFPILKHSDDTLFAGKVCAVLTRKYAKGRDFYDLIWYLQRGQQLNYQYLNKNLEQDGFPAQFTNWEEVVAALRKRIETVKIQDVVKDLSRFLEDPSEETWLRNYPALFEQLVHKRNHL